MTLPEGNKLIAEFMGYKLRLPNGMKNKYWEKKLGEETDVLCSENKLLYHSSWDWLMPVVSKIEEQGQSVSIFRGCCDIRFDKVREGLEEPEPIESGGGQQKIVSVWQSVVKYIQWYNTRKQNP